jgi:hypothetical protein
MLSEIIKLAPVNLAGYEIKLADDLDPWLCLW